MEITGFDEQIGFLPKINLPKLNFKNPLPKNLPSTSFLKNKIQAMKPAAIPNVSLTNLANRAKAMQVPQRTREQILQQAVEKAKQRGIVPQRTRGEILQQAVEKAKQKGIVPQRTRGEILQAMQQARQTGKSIIVNTPTGVKKLTPKPAFNLAPTASKAPSSFFKRALAPIKKDEVKRFENTLQAMPASQQAKAIFNLPPTPAVVKNLTPTQRSFLKTDLPYQVISKNNFGQPTTQVIKNTPFKFNINIDQIQPPVDGGISNYYGK
jgi:hypothetical protein